jgi:aspartyl-tRNA(Asn)/glutamyl-tRNA(Gln) amidotransferase subunit A
MNQDDILALDATALVHAYRRRTLSPREVVDAVLAAIERHNPVVNAFCLVDADGARQAAQASEQRWMREAPAGLLDGVPFTIKDAIMWTGKPSRAGSRTSPSDPAKENGPAVDDLLQAGAIPIGKTTLPEFGWKAVSDSPLTGITRNPWDTRMTAGGSSSGAGVAAALNLGPLHLGMDSAGSIRIPASFCGVFGLKPSHGRVPSYPPLPFALISDVGPLTRTVRDAALMMTIIADPDPRDIWALHNPAPDYRIGLDEGVRGLRIAWSPRLGFVDRIDPEVEQIAARAALVYESLGATVQQADPRWKDPIDIIKLMWRVGSCTELADVPPERRGECDPGFLAFAQAGEQIRATEFMKVVNERTTLYRTLAEFHGKYDLLLTPAVCTVPFEAGHNTAPDGRYGDDWFTWAKYSYPFDLTLQPAAIVPCGSTHAGLPVGLQIVGPYLRDDRVLRAARAFEAAQPWPRLDAPRVRHTTGA